jgi:rSAM/selenodomain-associated transferase 2
MPSLSIIVPTRRSSSTLRARLSRLARALPDAQVIVVEPDDLAPTGDEPALPAHVVRLRAPRGRGTQCNAGVRIARGELLMFLHDDTALPAGAFAAVAAAFADPRTAMTCFRLRFDRRHWLLGLYGWFSRFDSIWTTFGDQAMVVRHDLLDAVGGLPDWPLYEDVELARRMRRIGRIVKLPLTVTTSAVRYARNGIVRQQLANAVAITRFLLGASPWRLAAAYEGRR